MQHKHEKTIEKSVLFQAIMQTITYLCLYAAILLDCLLTLG